MTDGPYVAINLLTNDIVGRYESENSAWLNNKDEPITVIYRPLRRHKAKARKG